MSDAAGRRDRLDVVLLLQRLQPVPQPDPATEDDRDLHDVQVVDEPGGEELTQHRRATPDADVLARAHDLRADAVLVALGECVVDAGIAGRASAIATQTRCVPESGREHPLVEPVAGVTERRVGRLPLAGGESVERDREVVDADAGHGCSLGCRWPSEWLTRPAPPIHRSSWRFRGSLTA